MRRLTISEARKRKCALWYTRSCGERVQVAELRPWAKDILLRTTDGREWVISKRSMLEA